MTKQTDSQTPLADAFLAYQPTIDVPLTLEQLGMVLDLIEAKDSTPAVDALWHAFRGPYGSLASRLRMRRSQQRAASA